MKQPPTCSARCILCLVQSWSLRQLDSLLSRTMAEHGVRIPGVNSPYLYVGSWRSTFAW